MGNVLVFGEHQHAKFAKTTLVAITAGKDENVCHDDRSFTPSEDGPQITFASVWRSCTSSWTVETFLPA